MFCLHVIVELHPILPKYMLKVKGYLYKICSFAFFSLHLVGFSYEKQTNRKRLVEEPKTYYICCFFSYKTTV